MAWNGLTNGYRAYADYNAETDLSLKSSGRNPELTLEMLIMKICGR